MVKSILAKLAILFVAALGVASPAVAEIRFAVTLPASMAEAPVTGRLIVVAARNETPEPRLAIGMSRDFAPARP